MVKLQHILNRKQKKEVFSFSIPIGIVKLLGLKRGDEFAVNFNKDNKTIEYVLIQNEADTK